MKNFWPEKFEESQRVPAKSLLEEQAKLLPSLTDGIVFAGVSPMSQREISNSGMRNEFSFRFDILGKFLENYRFHVLSFSHSITLYPVKILLDEGIGKELGLKPNNSEQYLKEIESPEELENFVGLILKSQRLKNVIGSIIRLSH